MKSSARRRCAGHGRWRDHDVPDRRHRGRRDVFEQCAPGGGKYSGGRRAGIPVIVESVLWGSRIEDKRDPELLAFGARVAAEFGADAIKTAYTGDPETMRQVVEGARCRSWCLAACALLILGWS